MFVGTPHGDRPYDSFKETHLVFLTITVPYCVRKNEVNFILFSLNCKD